MRKILFSLTVACILASACKKESKPEQQNPDGKKYNVSFNITGFTQQYESIKTNAVTDSLIYPEFSLPRYNGTNVYICNDDDKEVAAGAVDMLTGNVSIELSAGHYTAYFLGYQDDNTAGLDPRQAQDATSHFIWADGNDGYFFYGANSIQQFSRESFYKKLDFTVSATNTAATPVQLKSIVAKIIIEVKDAIPENLRSITVNIDSLSKVFVFKGSYDLYKEGYYTGFNIPSNLYFQKGRKFAFFALVEPGSVRNVKLTCNFNGTSNTPKVNIIENVPMNPNTITMLSGNLFGGTGLKVDTAWNSEVIYKSF